MASINPYEAPESSLGPEKEELAYEQSDLSYYDAKRFMQLYHRSRNVNGFAFLAGLVALCALISDNIFGISQLNLLIFLFSTVTCIGLIKRANWGLVCGVIASILLVLLSCFIIVGGASAGFFIALVSLALLFTLLRAQHLFGKQRFTHRLIKAELEMRYRHRRL